jgi:peptidoglycan-associated lipoprotein
MKTVRSLIFSSITLVVASSLAGCSWFGSGSGDGEESGFSEEELAAQREGRFGAGNIPTAEGNGLFRDIRFSYDSYAIEGMARNDVEANAKILNDRSDLNIVLEGHCDERGTVEYNMALGAERARAVKNALIASGVASSRIETISYGEEIPLDPGQSESAYAQNRRVHFGVGSARAPKAQRSRY